MASSDRRGAVYVEPEDCVDCAPGYADHAACVDSVCVKPTAGGTEDPQPRPGYYL